MMNEHLERLYASVKEAVVAHHPHDESLVGAIAELFLKFDKDILILEHKSAVILCFSPEARARWRRNLIDKIANIEIRDPETLEDCPRCKGRGTIPSGVAWEMTGCPDCKRTGKVLKEGS